MVDRGSDQIISHPRVIEDSARRKDSKRAKKREKRKEKKALERTQKEEELKRIKNLMKESIKKQLSKIQETSGASGTPHTQPHTHTRAGLIGEWGVSQIWASRRSIWRTSSTRRSTTARWPPRSTTTTTKAYVHPRPCAHQPARDPDFVCVVRVVSRVSCV